jgi:hypothetical protein
MFMGIDEIFIYGGLTYLLGTNILPPPPSLFKTGNYKLLKLILSFRKQIRE